MPRFETFRKAQVPFTKEPHVTIQKRGTVTLNAAAYSLLDSPAAVELLYDPAEQVLGLRAIGADAPHAVFVRPSSRSAKGPWVISAMAFIRHYEIDRSQARRWTAQLEQDTLVVRLCDGGQVVSKDSTATHRPRPSPRR